MTSETTQETEVDVVVVGGGPAGENVAQYARGDRPGRTVAMVETELVGGECSYYACMPSKALLRPLDVAAAAAHLQGVSTPRIDRDELLARRDSWTSHYDDSGQVRWARGAGLDVVRGRGRLVADRTVEVTTGDGATQRIRAGEAVVLATGSTPTIPAPYADIDPWTSRDATGVREVPESLAVVGGGVVACEAARWMAALGTRVTVVVRGDRLLARAEPFVSELVAAGLRDAGIEVRFDAEVTAAHRGDRPVAGQAEGATAERLGRPHGGSVTLDLAGGGQLTVAEVLVATGRRPALHDLGLEVAGLDPDELAAEAGRAGGLVTGGPLPDWLYLVGDCSGGAPLTHWGKYQARRVGAAIAARAAGAEIPAAPATGPVPQVVFTDPQVAWVGQTLEEARERDSAARSLDADYASVAGASLLRDDLVGRARLVVGGDDRLLGATFVGADVAELLHAATVAVVGGLTLDVLREAVPSYPTASEVWLRLLEG